MKKSFLILLLSNVIGLSSIFASTFSGNVSSSFVSVTQTQASISFGWTIQSVGGITLWNTNNHVELFFEKIDSTNGNIILGSQYVNYTGVAGDSVNLGVAYLLTGLTAGHIYKVVPHIILYQGGSPVWFKDGSPLVFTTCGAAVSNASATICFGSSTTLSATGGTSYAWLPTTGLSNPNIGNPVASPTVSTTYTVTVSGTCTTTTTVAITVKTNTTPVSAVPTSGTAEACKVSMTPTIAFTLVPSGGVLSCNGIIFIGNSVNVSTLNAGTSVVTYTCTDNFGCKDSTMVNIQVDSLPEVNSVIVTGSGATKTVKVYGPLVGPLQMEIVGSTTHTYVASMQNSSLAIFNNVSYNGTEVMYLKYNSECFIEQSFVGVGEVVKDGDIRMFPNPVVDMLNLETPNGKYQIDIVNCLGQTVRSITTEEGNNFKIERDGLPSGVYFAKISSEKTNSSITKKLVMQ
ncbi:MAG: T9SS type A sorting domain-containing protein [Minisyncoccia bacterium]